MDHQAGFAVEGFVAFRTLVGPVGMDRLVSGKLFLVAKATPTFGADECTLAFPYGVCFLVDQQAGLKPEAFGTERADIRPPCCLGERLVTKAAFILCARVRTWHLLGIGFECLHSTISIHLS